MPMQANKVRIMYLISELCTSDLFRADLPLGGAIGVASAGGSSAGQSARAVLSGDRPRPKRDLWPSRLQAEPGEGNGRGRGGVDGHQWPHRGRPDQELR